MNQLAIQTYRITALWAFVECSLGGLAHALKLPFTGIYVGGGSIFCIVLLARFAGIQHIIPSLATVLSLKFALNPHSPIGAYLAVAFQGFLGYVLFRFSKFFVLNVLLLSFLSLLESAVQKILVLTLLYGKGFYVVLDKTIAETAKTLGFLHYPNSVHLFGVYVVFYALMGILIGILIIRYIRMLEKGNFALLELALQEIPQNSPETPKPAKKSSKALKAFATLAFISIFLYIWNEQSLWINFVLSLVMIVVWYWGLMKGIIWIAKKYRWNKWVDVRAQQEILNLLPQIKTYWRNSYHISQQQKQRRLSTFVHLFVGQVLFHAEDLPQSHKEDLLQKL